MSYEPGALAPAGVIPLSQPEFSSNEWKYLKECLDSGWVSSAGPFVSRFEQMVADFAGARHAVAIVNGTSALHLAMAKDAAVNKAHIHSMELDSNCCARASPW